MALAVGDDDHYRGKGDGARAADGLAVMSMAVTMM